MDKLNDSIKRSAVIDALNECIDIKGFAYKSLHDKVMEIPKENENERETISGV